MPYKLLVGWMDGWMQGRINRWMNGKMIFIKSRHGVYGAGDQSEVKISLNPFITILSIFCTCIHRI